MASSNGWLDDSSRLNLRSYIPELNGHINVSSPTEISTFGVPIQLVGSTKKLRKNFCIKTQMLLVCHSLCGEVL